MDAQTRQQRVDAVPWWYHSIDVGDGIVTPGKGGGTPWMLDRIGLPADLTGKRVLDVGSWDGFYAFAAEERGAEVLATDHFVWNTPGEAGMQGFLAAHELRGSKIEYLDIDVMEITPERVGTFDIVLFLGVLYHLRNPLDALSRLSAVCTDLIIVESEVTFVGEPRTPLARFYETTELAEDATNWWAPNPVALAQMVRSSGFQSVQEIDRWGECPPFERPPHGRSGLSWLKSAFYHAGMRADRSGIHRTRGNGRAVVHGHKTP